MPIELNHTIVASRDKEASARFVAHILGLPSPGHFAHFVTVETANGVSLDFDNSDNVRPQHYAFLVSDADFDAIMARIQQEAITYWADPGHQREGEINTRDRGRGLYFNDLSGHNLEVLTRPYGSGG
ncbi:MAG: VOC family protein [Clostridia bacterium]